MMTTWLFDAGGYHGLDRQTGADGGGKQYRRRGEENRLD